MNGDSVQVPRATLRSLRSMVAGAIVGVLVLVGLVVVVVVEDHQRCNAGNEFRSQDLPAAFRLHDQHLGDALGAEPDQIDAFSDDFEADSPSCSHAGTAHCSDNTQGE